MKKDDLEQQYRDITSMYDMAEELASTVESEFVANPEEQIALVEPLINAIADSTDVLAEEYISVLETPSRKKSASSRVEAALRRMFAALEEYTRQMGQRGSKTLAALVNIADPIVDKIKKQVEKITIIFLRMFELSLERIMHKHQAEEFRRAHDNVVALQLGH